MYGIEDFKVVFIISWKDREDYQQFYITWPYIITIVASVVVLGMGTSGQVFATSALRVYGFPNLAYGTYGQTRWHLEITGQCSIRTQTRYLGSGFRPKRNNNSDKTYDTPSSTRCHTPYKLYGVVMQPMNIQDLWQHGKYISSFTQSRSV
ncbi:hypothetical protein EVAR_69508_1 [Eumeta japonica]|uniref:Uncharacterized protein n=1 Tax=Eumeta variegata TaxID=151549 RepID=A0A4C2AB51_EUMVA|nr:hypothetical protein EVAR_69508_1 [Eumeta japonica]